MRWLRACDAYSHASFSIDMIHGGLDYVNTIMIWELFFFVTPFLFCFSLNMIGGVGGRTQRRTQGTDRLKGTGTVRQDAYGFPAVGRLRSCGFAARFVRDVCDFSIRSGGVLQRVAGELRAVVRGSGLCRWFAE